MYSLNLLHFSESEENEGLGDGQKRKANGEAEEYEGSCRTNLLFMLVADGT